jgi:hypothetical protein
LAPLARQDRRLPWRPGIALFDGDEHRVDDPLARLDCLDCLPDRTFARMSAGDILIQVRVGVEQPIRVRKTFAWPPRIARRQIAGLEGVPRRMASTRVRRASARVKSEWLSSSGAPTRRAGS